MQILKKTRINKKKVFHNSTIRDGLIIKINYRDVQKLV